MPRLHRLVDLGHDPARRLSPTRIRLGPEDVGHGREAAHEDDHGRRDRVVSDSDWVEAPYLVARYVVVGEPR